MHGFSRNIFLRINNIVNHTQGFSFNLIYLFGKFIFYRNYLQFLSLVPHMWEDLQRPGASWYKGTTFPYSDKRLDVLRIFLLC